MTRRRSTRLHDDGVGIVGGGLLGLAAGYRSPSAASPSRSTRPASASAASRARRASAASRSTATTTRSRLEDHRMLELAAELGLEDADPLAPARRRLLPRGPARLDVDAARGARASRASRWSTRRAWPRSWPAASSPATHAPLDDEPVGPWVRRTAGDRLWEQLFRPLLDSKFDGDYDDLPATYLWSRTRRTAGTRDKSGREVMGWIRGGHQVLADRLAEEIERLGGARAHRHAGPPHPVAGRARDRRRSPTTGSVAPRRRRHAPCCGRTSSA